MICFDFTKEKAPMFCAVICNSTKHEQLLLGNVSAEVTVGTPLACCVDHFTWPAMLTVQY